MTRYPTLTKPQRAILQFIADGHATYLKYFGGSPGKEDMRDPARGFYWAQYDRTQTAPPCDGRAINGLIKRELLRPEDDGDYAITDAGRIALGQTVIAETKYQWFDANDDPIPGATGPTLDTMSGKETCRITIKRTLVEARRVRG